MSLFKLREARQRGEARASLAEYKDKSDKVIAYFNQQWKGGKAPTQAINLTALYCDIPEKEVAKILNSAGIITKYGTDEGKDDIAKMMIMTDSDDMERVRKAIGSSTAKFALSRVGGKVVINTSDKEIVKKALDSSSDVSIVGIEEAKASEGFNVVISTNVQVGDIFRNVDWDGPSTIRVDNINSYVVECYRVNPKTYKDLGGEQDYVALDPKEFQEMLAER